MTASVDLERDLVAWLAETGPATVRAELVDDTLERARSVRQRRSSMPFVGAEPWPRPAQLDGFGAVSLLVALVALAVAGMALFLAGGRNDPRLAPTGPSVTLFASSVPAPSAIPSETSLPTFTIPRQLQGTWIAPVPSRATFDAPAPGTMRLRIDASGVRFDLPGLEGGGLLTMAPLVNEGSSQLRLTVDGPSVPFPRMRIDGSARGGCSTGAHALYGWVVAAGTDGTADRLELTRLEDQCSILNALLPGTWSRARDGAP